MDIARSILKIYPDWKGVVWENDYNKIVPHELEKRPIPSKSELQLAWAAVQKDMAREQAELDKETAIQTEITRIAREQAIANLTAKGEI